MVMMFLGGIRVRRKGEGGYYLGLGAYGGGLRSLTIATHLSSYVRITTMPEI
jgi:hypothetical protein